MIGPCLGRTEVVRRLRGADAITIRAAIHEVRTDTQHSDGPRAVFGEVRIWTRAALRPDDVIEWRERRYSVERSRHLGLIYIGELWRIEGSRGRAVAS